MALGSHLITVRRLKKYIDDVIGKKANLPDTSKTIIGNISQLNTDLSVLLQWELIEQSLQNTVSFDLTDYHEVQFVFASGNHHFTLSLPKQYLTSTEQLFALYEAGSLYFYAWVTQSSVRVQYGGGGMGNNGVYVYAR